ncbi:uracil-DNA glycosylase 2 [Actinomycetes bacterium]|nr:uracil-DNA glycosylase 2 [Actinomycetes bacterium]
MNVPETWREVLRNETSQTYFADLSEFVLRERKASTVFPSEHEVFTALQLTSPDNVRVVIVGQDPYHGAGQAHGLSFSVQHGTRIPPSLRNIYAELHSDLDIPLPQHGNLEAWAKQGVLLLNSTLTVREGEAGSHAGHGWETLTDAIISYLGSRQEHIVFVLWGAHAGRKTSLINQHHTVITSVHPSPLSAHRGFFGSRPFSQINRALADHNQPEINWVIA